MVTEHDPLLPRTPQILSLPKRKRHLKGAVPPVKVAVNVTSCSANGLLLETVNDLIVNGGLENVNVTEWLDEIDRALLTFRKIVLPCVIETFLIRLKRLAVGLRNVMLFWPWTTKAVMSKGPRLMNWFAPGAESGFSIVALRTNGKVTTTLPLTRTCSGPMPLWKAVKLNAWNVRRIGCPAPVETTVIVWLAIDFAPLASVTLSMTVNVPAAKVWTAGLTELPVPSPKLQTNE